MNDIVKPNAKMLATWAESADHESLSPQAKEHRLAGRSYLVGCTFKTRGELVAVSEDAQGVVMGGLENYLIWPMEEVAFLPLKPTWRQRIGLWIAGLNPTQAQVYPPKNYGVVEGWRPIESAPVSEPVLLWNGDFTTIASQHAPTGVWVDHCETNNSSLIDYPTHWRPLPAPPAIDAAIEEGG